jgi:hypothetical protein
VPALPVLLLLLVERARQGAAMAGTEAAVKRIGATKERMDAGAGAAAEAIDIMLRCCCWSMALAAVRLS